MAAVAMAQKHDGRSAGEILGLITLFFGNLLAVLFFYVYSADDPAIQSFQPETAYEAVQTNPEEARKQEAAGQNMAGRTASAVEDEELQEPANALNL